ncbi:MAG: hypothetical protein JST54_13935 [Deltaproteobacteria bacterium]|nr:hypothetical protein [Deltaproteobacteria bacterium]
MSAPSRVWLFGRNTDLAVFGGSALAALLLVVIGRALGIAHGDTPPAFWLLTVLCVDVAHVWSTAYRTYADPAEVRRRPMLYLGAPLLVYALGVLLHASGGPARFWRVLAYAAVFHFVRQQYGWVALYRRRGGESGALGKWIDTAAIYLSSIAPLIWWHAAPPRQFHWFLDGDFALGLPAWVGTLALGLEAVALAAYMIRAIAQAVRGDVIPWGKHLVVSTTALCWYFGIVAFDSDYIFTVTNVLIHGIPYVALTWRYGARRFATGRELAARLFAFGWPAVYLALVVVAFAEEGLWDNLVWHDHAQFFGDAGLELGPLALALAVPLLALPQGVHYLLDGFIWRVGPKNPQLAERLALGE